MAKSQSGTTALLSPLVTLVALAVAWAAGAEGPRIAGAPALVWAAGLAIGLQWIAFVPAFLKQTEHFYDLFGSLTWLSVSGLSLLLGSLARAPGPRQLLVTALVWIWAARLGSFLFKRVRESGKDGRFDEIKPNFFRFLNAWTLQGLWIFLTALAVLVLNSRADPGGPVGPIEVLGLLIWVGGFAVEVIADRQKAAFRARPDSRGRWIDEGLWSRSRHPNYLGEIVLWTGIFLIGAPVYQGAEWLALLSPVFVALLLTRGSGVPLLEARADARWGGDPAYEAYKARVPVLIPRLRR